MTDTKLQLLYKEREDLIDQKNEVLRELDTINTLIHNVSEKIYIKETGLTLGTRLNYQDFTDMEVVGYVTREDGFKIQLKEPIIQANIEVPTSDSSQFKLV